VVFLAPAARRVPAHRAGLLERVGPSSTSAPTSPPAGAYARCTGPSTGAPSSRRVRVRDTGAFRDDIAGAAHVASPGAYPTAAALALAPLVAAAWSSPTGSRSTRCRGSGRGPGLSAATSTPSRRRLTAYGSSTPQTGEIEFALSRMAPSVAAPGPLHPPVRPDGAGGSSHTCHPPRADGCRRVRSSTATAGFYARCPSVQVLDEARTPRPGRVQRAHLRSASTNGRPLAPGSRNLGKGAAGQAVQNANLLLGSRGCRSSTPPGSGRERHRRRRLRAAGWLRIKADGPPDLALGATSDRAPVTRRPACFTSNRCGRPPCR